MTDGIHQRPEISLDLAQSLLHGVRTAAAEQELAVAAAVVDPGGHVIASMRMDGAPLGAFELAVNKAYTAAMWQMPSGDLHDSTQPGGDDWGLTSTAGGRIVVYKGGVPVFAAGALAGAVGVSGGTGDQDLACAQAAVDAAGL